MGMSTAQSLDTSASLSEAFHAFNEASAQLAEAYGRLEGQVARLAAELAQSRVAHSGERQEKRQLADRLSALLEVLPAAVVLVDGRGRVDRFNPVAEGLFPGLSWGRRWHEVRDEHLASQVADGDWLLRDGRHLSVSARELGDGGSILLMIDDTEQRALEERARRQDRLADMGEMAAQLAHQIRTPLATALLYGGQLARPELSDAQRRQFAATLVEGLKHTERLVADMLAFSRGGQFQPVPVQLRSLVEHALDTLHPRFQALHTELILDIDEQIDDGLLGNGDALIGVITNLLENALDHAGEGACIRVELRGDARELRLRVEDDGPGIPADLRRQIFDPFFTTRERGTGLGLAVAQSTVLAHGGSLEACDSALGGACFRVILPASARNEAPGASHQGEA
ncbi:MAG: histidine kinase [Gammaproteobacteria bacterium]|nr:MAG: histidine kinase [Gammaproteobacteria bacterium]